MNLEEIERVLNVTELLLYKCFFFLKKLVLLVFLYLLLIVLISNMIKLLQAENGILTLKEEKSRKE